MFLLILSIVAVGAVGTATAATVILPPRQIIRRPVPPVGIAREALTSAQVAQRRQRLPSVSAQPRENQGIPHEELLAQLPLDGPIPSSFNLTSLPTAPGLYALISRQTGRAYIGESVNILQRLRSHRSMLERRTHFCQALQVDFDDHGIESFEVIILEQAAKYQDRATRRAREKELINALPFDRRYNLVDRRGERNSFAGRSHSQEVKDRLSAERKGILKPERGRPLSIPPFRTRKGVAHEGGTFPSLAEAARVTGMARRDIRSRIKDPCFPDWKEVDPDLKDVGDRGESP